MPNGPLDTLAEQIDAALERNDANALGALLQQCETLLDQHDGVDRVTLHYLKANAIGNLSSLRGASIDEIWSWHQPEAIDEILSLRRAIAEPAFEDIESVRRCQIRTNLGSRLSSIGRSIEAIEQWDLALIDVPDSAMAQGNKGIGLVHYARSLYDYSHAAILMDYAHDALDFALSADALWDSGPHPMAAASFHSFRDEARSYLMQVGYSGEWKTQKWSLGESDAERAYRQWCLANRLFLNPINDACQHTIASTDVVHLPSHTYSIDEPPRFPAFYNVLKQEFVSARYSFYESQSSAGRHFSDRKVLRIDTLDYPVLNRDAELLKSAFKSAYSLFDKVSLFLNEYLSIGLAAGDVNFRRVWLEKPKGARSFRPRPNLEAMRIAPLRGLYFQSKDLFDENMSDVAEPDAKQLATLRNRAEHRFLTLHEESPADDINDTAHSSVSVTSFERKTLRLLKMSRAALIYLSLAMFQEEARRANHDDDQRPRIPIFPRTLE